VVRVPMPRYLSSICAIPTNALVWRAIARWKKQWPKVEDKIEDMVKRR